MLSSSLALVIYLQQPAISGILLERDSKIKTPLPRRHQSHCRPSHHCDSNVSRSHSPVPHQYQGRAYSFCTCLCLLGIEWFRPFTSWDWIQTQVGLQSLDGIPAWKYGEDPISDTFGFPGCFCHWACSRAPPGLFSTWRRCWWWQLALSSKLIFWSDFLFLFLSLAFHFSSVFPLFVAVSAVVRPFLLSFRRFRPVQA